MQIRDDKLNSEMKAFIQKLQDFPNDPILLNAHPVILEILQKIANKESESKQVDLVIIDEAYAKRALEILFVLSNQSSVNNAYELYQKNPFIREMLQKIATEESGSKQVGRVTIDAAYAKKTIETFQLLNQVTNSRISTINPITNSYLSIFINAKTIEVAYELYEKNPSIQELLQKIANGQLENQQVGDSVILSKLYAKTALMSFFIYSYKTSPRDAHKIFKANPFIKEMLQQLANGQLERINVGIDIIDANFAKQVLKAFDNVVTGTEIIFSFIEACNRSTQEAYKIYKKNIFIKNLLEDIAKGLFKSIQVGSINLDAEYAKKNLAVFEWLDHVSNTISEPSAVATPGFPITTTGSGIPVVIPESPIVSMGIISSFTQEDDSLPNLDPIETNNLKNKRKRTGIQPPLIDLTNTPEPTLQPIDLSSLRFPVAKKAKKQSKSSNEGFPMTSSLMRSTELNYGSDGDTETDEDKLADQTNNAMLSSTMSNSANQTIKVLYKNTLNVKVYDVTDLFNEKYDLYSDIKLTAIPLEEIKDMQYPEDGDKADRAREKFMDSIAKNCKKYKNHHKLITIQSEPYVIVSGEEYTKYGTKTATVINYVLSTPAPFTKKVFNNKDTYDACEKFCENANNLSSSKQLKPAKHPGFVQNNVTSNLPEKFQKVKFDIKQFIKAEQFEIPADKIPNNLSITFFSTQKEMNNFYRLLGKRKASEAPDNPYIKYEGYLGEYYVYACIIDERQKYSPSEKYPFITDESASFPLELAPNFEKQINDETKYGKISNNLFKSIRSIMNKDETTSMQETNEQAPIVSTQVTDDITQAPIVSTQVPDDVNQHTLKTDGGFFEHRLFADRLKASDSTSNDPKQYNAMISNK